MRKLAFLQKEPLSRLGVAFLLTVGIALPLLIALGLSANAPLALLLALLLLIALTVLNATVRSRRVLWVVTGEEKAAMLARLARVDTAIPAGRVSQDRALVLADRAAAAALGETPGAGTTW